MRTADLRTLEPAIENTATTYSPSTVADDAVLTEVCAALFTFLRRSDQRRKGEEYLRGLLAAPGRKSIRSMAAVLGGRGTAQSLHHFICSSTWDWVPVRRGLARYLVETAPPAAWVLHPLVIPKGGQHSVGVGRFFSPADGQLLSAQQAVGLWAASERFTGPVNWKLHLPGSWFEASGRGDRAPEAGSERPGDPAVEAYLEAMSDWGLPALPVVVNLETAETLPVVRALYAAGAPFAARIGGNLALTVDDPALTGYGSATLPAMQIMHAARKLRRPVAAPGRPGGPAMVAAVRVREPSPGEECPATLRRGRRLLLWGVGAPGADRPDELWLSDVRTTRPAALLRLSGLAAKVEHDVASVSENVGIRDYVGRSYAGWHRHITLASAAHAVVVRSAYSAWPLNRAS
ncbi:IS701 family transposase [Nonomuraea longicatena]|uniref:Transposase n=1 Tax=Nonomuraea longicatena TaxID=83682 RepID=A0ABP4A4J4_9ACTN